jgi:hypothetical protein
MAATARHDISAQGRFGGDRVLSSSPNTDRSSISRSAEKAHPTVLSYLFGPDGNPCKEQLPSCLDIRRWMGWGAPDLLRVSSHGRVVPQSGTGPAFTEEGGPASFRGTLESPPVFLLLILLLFHLDVEIVVLSGSTRGSGSNGWLSPVESPITTRANLASSSPPGTHAVLADTRGPLESLKVEPSLRVSTCITMYLDTGQHFFSRFRETLVRSAVLTGVE